VPPPWAIQVPEQARINDRFSRGSYQPVRLKVEHHEPEVINRYYRAADVCMVTSLHDGMNLVAKEYVASRDDERGVLVLSQFTGAAHELHEALIVNPYHIEQTADALFQALTMPDFEQRERMLSMRALVRDFNVYPRSLKGEEILISARILAVADVVEAMASHRPYRPALGLDAALEEIEKNRGILYDSHVADTCLRVFRERNYQIRAN
jgi:glycosyltransferase involved in cell wall biosynthesis